MRCVGVIALAALLCLSAPAAAHCHRDHIASRCLRYPPYPPGMVPGRGIANSIVGLQEWAPPRRFIYLPPGRPPAHVIRRPAGRPYFYSEPVPRHRTIRREAHRGTEGSREPKPARESVELDQAPPRHEAATAGPAAETPSRGEAIKMQRQREEWLNGLSEKNGFERW